MTHAHGHAMQACPKKNDNSSIRRHRLTRSNCNAERGPIQPSVSCPKRLMGAASSAAYRQGHVRRCFFCNVTIRQHRGNAAQAECDAHTLATRLGEETLHCTALGGHAAAQCCCACGQREPMLGVPAVTAPCDGCRLRLSSKSDDSSKSRLGLLLPEAVGRASQLASALSNPTSCPISVQH